MTDAPLLWFLNRGTGVVLLTLLSASMVLGVLSLGGRAAGDGGGRIPRFVTQSLHRNLALGSVLLVIAHATTAVVDEYVDIRWWQALVPFGGTYEPLWLGLGTFSLDLMIAVALTSLLRARIGLRSWRAVHLTSWLSWAVGVVHGVGIGTDLKDPHTWATWAAVPSAVSVIAVLLALGWRLSTSGERRPVVVATDPRAGVRSGGGVR